MPRPAAAAASVAALIALALPFLAQAFDDNALIGQPEIQCNTDTIEMQFRTRKMFEGKVYVKGHFNNPDCRVDYSQKTPDGKPAGGIRLNHGACNMDRQRMIAPEGMMFSTVLVISFHPLFVTKMDRAFHIKCMYRETQRTVNQQLDVSGLPTESLEVDFPMPSCTYTIRKEELNGAVLKYARVGDQVVHRWECDSDSYGVLVHSCYVEDGQGERQMIVDERGCHTDKMLLGDPTYVEALNLAYRESYVFKFADRVQIRFQCEIRLCMKDEGGCEGVTPPLCFDENHRHVSEKGAGAPALAETPRAIGTGSSHNATMAPAPVRAARSVERRSPRVFKPLDADLYSQYVIVLDDDENDNGDGNKTKSKPSSSSAAATDSGNSGASLAAMLRPFSVDAASRHASDDSQQQPPQSGVCLSPAGFTLFVSLMATLLVAVAAVALYLFFLYLRYSRSAPDTKVFYS